MRILITGDRNWRDALSIHDRLVALWYNWEKDHDPLGTVVADPSDITIVHGDARGADTIADVCAQLIGFTIERHPADWDTYGRGAGPIRNQQMLDSGIDYYIAFHENLNESKGTADMVSRCRKAGIHGEVIERGQVENLGS